MKKNTRESHDQVLNGVGLVSGAEETSEGHDLDRYWVGSLDFNFFGKYRCLPLNPQKVKLFAGGSTATK